MKLYSLPLAAAFVLLIVGTSACASVLVEWDTGSGGNGHWYELVGTLGQANVQWATAKTDAEKMQNGGIAGHLATVTSAEENAFLQSAFNDGVRHAAWIGLTDDEFYGGQESGGPGNPGAPYWVWVTGEPVTYTNWHPGEPNNMFGDDYTEFVFGATGLWNDLPDFAPHLRDFYIVEYDAVPAGDRSWINPAGGAFETDGNWNPAAFPTAADNAIFDLDDQYTVTFAGDAETAAVSVFADDVTFDLNSHTYTLTGGSTLGDVAGDIGRLTVTDGVVEGRTVVMGGEVGSEGSLTVTTGGTWNHPQNTMVVGRLGDGTFTVESGGTVNSKKGEVARDAGSSGLAVVSGALSSWTVRDELFVGQGGAGDLEVSAGGSVQADRVNLGEDTDSIATATVTGTDSSLTADTRLTVGRNGTGALQVLAGGSATSNIIDAGFENGGSGSITVSGADSELTADTELKIGRSGQGTLSISNQGTVTSNFKARLAENEGASGGVSVTGIGSLLDVADFFSVATRGNGTVTIAAGGTVTDLVSIIGQNATAVGTATVTGAGSSWTHTDRLEVGDFGDGTLDVTAGGVVVSGNGLIGRRVDSTGDASVSGTDSAWNMSGSLFVGGDIIGAGGDGQLTVSDTAIVDVSDTVVVWQTGAIHLDNGEVEAQTAVIHGAVDGSGLLDINNVTSHGTISPGMSAGKITVDGALVLGATSTVEIEINGSIADSEYDVLEITGAATLAGTLAVTVDAGFTPGEGEAFDVVTFASHGGSEFDSITGLSLPDGRALIEDYTSTELRLIASYFGDGNLDGVVDGLDYLLWANAFGDNPPADPPGAPQNGDYNNDGMVDGIDYLLWAGNFGQSISATAVPEPGTFSLLIVGCVVVFARRRR